MSTDLAKLLAFIGQPTPKAWIDAALENIPLLLIDHAHCERKAAATAINMISKYPEKTELVKVMSPLAREELLHFEKVLDLMTERGIKLCPLPPTGYAQLMHKEVTSRNVDERLKDQLLIGAIIEARSCERFHALIPHLPDPQLAKFYNSLVRSEARHFEDYLGLAELYHEDISERLEYFLRIENTLIQQTDPQFRFHSGVPSI